MEGGWQMAEDRGQTLEGRRTESGTKRSGLRCQSAEAMRDQ